MVAAADGMTLFQNSTVYMVILLLGLAESATKFLLPPQIPLIGLLGSMAQVAVLIVP